MEPSWNPTSGPPQTTPEPIWAYRPQSFQLLGKKKHKTHTPPGKKDRPQSLEEKKTTHTQQWRSECPRYHRALSGRPLGRCAWRSWAAWPKLWPRCSGPPKKSQKIPFSELAIHGFSLGFLWFALMQGYLDTSWQGFKVVLGSQDLNTRAFDPEKTPNHSVLGF